MNGCVLNRNCPINLYVLLPSMGLIKCLKDFFICIILALLSANITEGKPTVLNFKNIDDVYGFKEKTAKALIFRTKRSQYGYGNNFGNQQSYPPREFWNNQVHPTISPQILSWMQRPGYLDSYTFQNVYENNNYKPSWNNIPPYHDNLQFNDKRINDFNKNVKTETKIKGSNGFLYFLGAMGVLSLLSIIIHCIKQSNAQNTSIPNQIPCSHRICIRHRNTDPSVGCILEMLNSSNNTAPFLTEIDIDDGDEDNTTPIDHSAEVTIVQGDLPPAYNDYENSNIAPTASLSNDRSNSDMPPSYEEAVENITLNST